MQAAAEELPLSVWSELSLRVATVQVSILPLPPLGAPIRHQRAPRLPIEEGRSVRWILNSRAGRDQGWHYTQVVYNVALADPSDLRVFVREPAAVVDERAVLR